MFVKHMPRYGFYVMNKILSVKDHNFAKHELHVSPDVHF